MLFFATLQKVDEEIGEGAAGWGEAADEAGKWEDAVGMGGEVLKETDGARLLTSDVEPMGKGHGQRDIGGIADRADDEEGDASGAAGLGDGFAFHVDGKGAGFTKEGGLGLDGFHRLGAAGDAAEMATHAGGEAFACFGKQIRAGEVFGDDEIGGAHLGIEAPGETRTDTEGQARNLLCKQPADAVFGDRRSDPNVFHAHFPVAPSAQGPAEIAAFLGQGKGDDDGRMGHGGWE